jgi:hypothetical protein
MCAYIRSKLYVPAIFHRSGYAALNNLLNSETFGTLFVDFVSVLALSPFLQNLERVVTKFLLNKDSLKHVFG